MLETYLNVTHNMYGFHGTDGNAAIGIAGEGFIIPAETRDDHWLGNGVYFFREDLTQAKLWGINQAQRTNSDKYAVIGVKITVPNKKFLNLDNRDGVVLLDRFIKELERRLVENGIGLKFSGKTEEQCRHLAFSLLSSEEYPVIQRTFKTSSGLNETYAFKSMGLFLHGVQLCVRDPASVFSEGPNVVLVEKTPMIQIRKKRKPPKLLD